MKINIGDKVRFLNDVGEGIVTKINRNVVQVMTNDGFELPVQDNELVVVEAAKQETIKPANHATEKVLVEPQPELQDAYDEIEGNDTPSIFFAFVAENPEDVLGSEVCLYLINDCNYVLSYVISSGSGEVNKYIAHGLIEPNTKILLRNVHFDELIKINYFLLQFILFKKNDFEPVEPVAKLIKLNHKKFVKNGCFETNDFFDEKAMIFSLTDNLEESVSGLEPELITEINKEKQFSEEYMKNAATRFRAKPEPVITEVDLHINQLLSDCRGMSNHEILEYQMKEFHQKIKEALVSNVHRIVFIHGIGNGTLKTEIRRSLAEDYPELKFQDASYKEYGFGATMVVIRS